MADLSPDRQQAVERLKGVLTLYAGLKPPRVAVNFDDLRLALSALDGLTTERGELARLAVTEPVRIDEHAVVRCEECQSPVCTHTLMNLAGLDDDKEDAEADRDAQRARADDAERERDEAVRLMVTTPLRISDTEVVRCEDCQSPICTHLFLVMCHHSDDAEDAQEDRDTLRTQLAAAEAERARLREALEDVAVWIKAVTGDVPSKVREALAPPPAPEGKEG